MTSLHYHFPWLVTAYLRWSVFCAVTKRQIRKTLDWEPFYAVAKMDRRTRRSSLATPRSPPRGWKERFEELLRGSPGHLEVRAPRALRDAAAKDAVR